MHGAGNDYVYVDCFAQPLPDDPAELARQIAHRRFGVGADGLILIRPSQVADARMQMFNADGSEAEMCGNGIRCVAKYVYDHGICRRDTLRIETGAGVLPLDLEVWQGQGRRACASTWASRSWSGRASPRRSPGDPVVDRELAVAGQPLSVTCVSMGNPHCVVFVDEATDELVLGLGPQIEHDPHFPARVNVEFVEVDIARRSCGSARGNADRARPGRAARGPVPCAWRVC